MVLVIVSVKLEEETVKELDNLSQRLGETRSAIIREAIRDYLRRNSHLLEGKTETEGKPQPPMKEKRIVIRI
jgi:metal-responsive CopG/Arc/MetJ family transcriptional regulator